MGTDGSARAVLLGLGSNLGDRLATLRSACAALRREPGVGGLRASRVYDSPPMGPVAQGPFLNAAVELTTALPADELLALALRIEREHGRERKLRWGPRTLDLDVLWIEGETVSEPGLTVPHPGLGERAFVLRPVADLRPELVLPDGRTAADAVEALNNDGCVLLPGAHLDG